MEPATDSVYSLAELAEHVELQPRAKVKTSGLGRNSTLFESLHHWAYGLAPKATSFESLLATIEAQAEAVNASFATALPAKELKFTTKSVAKFCWSNRHRFGQRVALFDQPGMEGTPRFERAHQAIITRFGRYPHRNAIVGRSSTAERLAFLSGPGSSF